MRGIPTGRCAHNNETSEIDVRLWDKRAQAPAKPDTSRTHTGEVKLEL
jgi:hypothetical protein